MKRKINNNNNNNTISVYNIYQLNELKNKSIQFDKVEISICCFHPIDLEKIPKSISTLKFNYNYVNLPCDIPINIKSVYFYEFSGLIEELPNNIEHIKIHHGFNHPVDKIHNNLKSIEFGINFNHLVDNLPTSLEKIVFSTGFSQSINNLPSEIKIIHIHNTNYDLTTIKTLPKSIVFLQLGLDLNSEFETNSNDSNSNSDFDFDFDFTFDLHGKNFFSPGIEKNYGCGMYESPQCPYLRNIYFYK